MANETLPDPATWSRAQYRHMWQWLTGQAMCTFHQLGSGLPGWSEGEPEDIRDGAKGARQSVLDALAQWTPLPNWMKDVLAETKDRSSMEQWLALTRRVQRLDAVSPELHHALGQLIKGCIEVDRIRQQFHHVLSAYHHEMRAHARQTFHMTILLIHTILKRTQENIRPYRHRLRQRQQSIKEMDARGKERIGSIYTYLSRIVEDVRQRLDHADLKPVLSLLLPLRHTEMPEEQYVGASEALEQLRLVLDYLRKLSNAHPDHVRRIKYLIRLYEPKLLLWYKEYGETLHNAQIIDAQFREGVETFFKTEQHRFRRALHKQYTVWMDAQRKTIATMEEETQQLLNRQRIVIERVRTIEHHLRTLLWASATIIKVPHALLMDLMGPYYRGQTDEWLSILLYRMHQIQEDMDQLGNQRLAIEQFLYYYRDAYHDVKRIAAVTRHEFRSICQ
jgi:hypothetical protein